MADSKCPVCGRESDGVCRHCLVDGLFSEESDLFELPGDLGGFRLLKRIGRGASGEVWQAFQPGPDREVALKVFLDPRLGGTADRSRFMAEAQALGKLDHPGIVPVYATGEDAGFLFIASRWMKGGTLADRSPVRGDRNGCRGVVEILSKLARAVAHAHRHGLVHRDIKPANVLLDPEGEPCLADFGIAVAAGLDESGSTSGTPAYMAPEQARGDAVTTSVDIFGLGAVMFDLLAGQPPDRKVEKRWRSLASVDLDAAAICQRCLSEDPGQRYGSADDLADDLDRWLAGEPVKARPVGWNERLLKWAKRRPAQAGLSGLAAASALALAIILVVGSDALRRERNVAVEQERLARSNAERAEQTADDLREHAYAADVYLASRAIEDGQLGVARSMLERHVPEDGEPDVRGFEWAAYLAMCGGDDERMFADHQAAVTSVAFSPDGRHVASVGRDGLIFVREVETGRLALSLPEADAPVGAAEIPLMAKLVAASPEIRNRILRAELNPDEVRMRGRPARLGDLTAVAWAPDGTRFATGAAGAYVRLWSFPDGKLTGLLPLQSVREVRFVRDGSHLAVLHGYGQEFAIRIYDLDSMTEVWKSAPAEPAMAVHKDRLAWMEIGGGPLRVIDLRSFEEVSELPASIGLSALGYSIDGSRLFGVSPDGRAERMWKPDGQVVAPDELPNGAVRSVVATSGGFAVAGTGQTVVIRSGENLSSRQVMRGHEDEILCLSVSTDGRRIASGAKDRTVRIWRLGEMAESSEGAAGSGLEIVAHGPDASRWLAQSRDGAVLLGSVGGPIMPLDPSVDRKALCFDRKGERAATWRSEQGEFLVEWWDAVSGEKTGEQRIEVEADEPWLARGESGWLAVTGPDSGLQLFDLESGELQWSLPDPDAGILRLSVSPKGDAVAGFMWPRFVMIGSRERGWSEQIKMTDGTMGPMVFSPDGRWLISGNDENRVAIHDVETAARIRVLSGHRAPLAKLAVSPDGRTLASSSSDRTMRLWHLPTWRELGVMERGHVMSYLGFSNDSESLLVAPWNHSLRLLPETKEGGATSP
ncbi:F-box/WD repeat-containing protein isoform 1 [Haloferula helveola]|uniref:F-box/WD repeat-containing protein isoform 1 n=1 Tax=Haloferula helveola TaxID=490095 RepID=A0ABM7RDY5_9BACT|nr:F-box/WD repeat-containing protein isoform 1 [Haloferula helveola]